MPDRPSFPPSSHGHAQVTPWLPAAVVLALLTLSSAFVAAGAATAPDGMALPLDAPAAAVLRRQRAPAALCGAPLRAAHLHDRGTDHDGPADHRPAHHGRTDHDRRADDGRSHDRPTDHRAAGNDARPRTTATGDRSGGADSAASAPSGAGDHHRRPRWRRR